MKSTEHKRHSYLYSKLLKIQLFFKELLANSLPVVKRKFNTQKIWIIAQEGSKNFENNNKVRKNESFFGK